MHKEKTAQRKGLPWVKGKVETMLPIILPAEAAVAVGCFAPARIDKLSEFETCKKVRQ